MTVRQICAALALAGVLVLPACDATGDDPTELFTDPPFGEPPGEGDAVTVPPDAPVPVEEDGGIGGEGPVTSNLILPPDQVEVTGTCLVTEDPPTYRLTLAGGGALTVATGDRAETLTLEHAGRTYRSPDDEPPVITRSGAGISAQGRTVADDGSDQFVDAVIALDDLPPC